MAIDYKEFLSTPSARRATPCPQGSRRCRRYFYPRPPRGGRPSESRLVALAGGISIHALREEGDMISGAGNFPVRKFLSTPSARRAT